MCISFSCISNPCSSRAAMQSIFRQLPKLWLLFDVCRAQVLHWCCCRRVCREEGNENLQLYSSGIVMRGGGGGGWTAHLDIKHLVKNCWMDKGGYSCPVRERLRGFLGENVKETDLKLFLLGVFESDPYCCLFVSVQVLPQTHLSWLFWFKKKVGSLAHCRFSDFSQVIQHILNLGKI